MTTAIEYSIVIPTTGLRPSIQLLMSDLETAGYLDRPDIEVLVVENSDRPNPEFTRKMAKWEVRHLLEPKRGQANALNCGVSASEGKYIVFTDDDVRIKEGPWLETLSGHFRNRDNVGYVAGNVVASSIETPVQALFEKKGGLSKGLNLRVFNQAFFKRFRLCGVPLRHIACGANSMVPRSILEIVGGFDPLFGCGSKVGHGQSHELVYKILQAGFDAVYEPAAIVYHAHPRTRKELRRKLFDYAIGDTAVHLHFFVKYADFRGLIEAFFARHVYLLKNTLLRLLGRYPFPLDLMAASLLGATLGPFVYLRARLSWR